ncbi:MAG: hypothetical protein H7Z14_12785 [Anaerolineae bacterium]|nr:hypothetical protein [Phycisphaerae bacterium]
MRVRLFLGAGAMVIIGLGISLVGCDDRRNLVPVIAPQAAATQPARPTTQELLQGESTRVALKAIPFWISVPRGWELKSQAGVIVLEGPTPTGIAQLGIGRHLAPIAQHDERLIEGAKREAAAKPGPYTLADVRDSGGLKVLETRSVGKTLPMPAIDNLGNKIADTTTRMDWKTIVFVPDGRDVAVCEIHFIDLTREQYDQDKELLTKIMSSLQYDPRASNN